MQTIQQLEQTIFSLVDTRDQLKRFVFDRSDEAFTAGDAARDELHTTAQLAERRSHMRDAFLQAIGGLPSMDTPLLPRSTGSVSESGLRIENIVFHSRPGHPVTGNLYLPASAPSPGAAVLFLCGHEPDSRVSPLYQRVCRQLAAAGLIVLSIDPLGQGERRGYLPPPDGINIQPGTHEHQHTGAQCLPLGDSLARYFVHDAMRAIDYLCTRPEVDPARIGVTGNSGGGTQTTMLMVCDDRLAAAAPATFIMNRQQYMHAGGVQDAEQVWPGLSALGFDHEDLLLIFAPKPLHVLAVSSDFFPIEATRRTVSRARRFWELEHRGDKLEFTVDDATHSYTERLGEAAADFFSRSLLGCPVQFDEALDTTRLRAPQELWAIASGQVLLEDPSVVTIQAENVRRAEQLRAKRSESDLQEQALAWLRRRLLEPRRPARLETRKVPIGRCLDWDAEYRMWWSQSGVMNSGILLRGIDHNASVPIVIGLWEGGTTQLAPHEDWIRETISSGTSVLVFNPSGVGPHMPHPIHGQPPLAFFGILHKLADDLLWLGDSLAAMRAYDVIRCVDMLLQDAAAGGASHIDIHTHGRCDLYARLAAAVDTRIGSLTCNQGISSISAWVGATYYEESDAMSFILPGMLQYFDLDELERWRTSTRDQPDKKAGDKQ
ncbi:alpha/beta hydrolase family protein [Paenibacillus daejeonensis]|uniref:alpha/beta hydrolase family protein n=1 Tax=Paenibacillus daejeonensis TaxID=135193 RepID=UPI000382A054|nr:prolyl oligopeptidase family serine peptidase [Paenibacillus daejeonensis]